VVAQKQQTGTTAASAHFYQVTEADEAVARTTRMAETAGLAAEGTKTQLQEQAEPPRLARGITEEPQPRAVPHLVAVLAQRLEIQQQTRGLLEETGQTHTPLGQLPLLLA
jgi:hypothetical protein